MTRTFTAVACIFCTLELLAVYQLWFDENAEQFPSSLAPGSFAGFRDALRRKDVKVIRQIQFYGLWVGNNKFIFSALLAVCAASNDAKTRILASLATAVGCALYFWRMHAAYTLMEERGDVRPMAAKEIGDLIGGICLPMWSCAVVAELHAATRGRDAKGKAKQG